ncbi:MAG: universal stress protein [Bacteroidales bacterium]|jgi:nucleotide-binding universal stress UspA family protein|nr:universal stress protein [Bacteroidales bacterium]MCU0407465.1 universal stress protein [Bacteroidales bacterium]
MKKVLIAVDYDPSARKVAKMGYELATAMNSKVILLHVVANDIQYTPLDYSPITGFGGYMDINPLKQESLDWARKTSEQFLENLKDHLSDEKISVLVEEGDIPSVILKCADENNVSMIVMGTHSRRWFEEILMGSVSEKVLHNTSKPVFIIPMKTKE